MIHNPISNFNDLVDVSVPTPTDGYLVYWDAATSLWKCRSIAFHADLTTGTHGVGESYICLAPAASHLVRAFTKGWTANKLLIGAGAGADPNEIDPPDPAGAFYDSLYPPISASSAAEANSFGSWVLVKADIGTNKRLYYIVLTIVNAVNWEIEIGKGASGSEVAVARAYGCIIRSTDAGYFPVIVIPIHVNLTNNARITVRVRDNSASARTYYVALLVGTH